MLQAWAPRQVLSYYKAWAQRIFRHLRTCTFDSFARWRNIWSSEIEMAPRKSPRDAKCPHCGRHFTKGGLKQHMRHVKCSPTSTASPRNFERVRCKHCSKSFHSTNSLRVHVSTVHPKEYAKSPGHMKHHRAPYKSKKRSPESSRPAHASTRTELSPSPRPRAGDHYSGHHAIRLPSSSEPRDYHHRPSPSYSSKNGGEPTWQSEMKKKLAEAAKGKDRQQVSNDAWAGS